MTDPDETNRFMVEGFLDGQAMPDPAPARPMKVMIELTGITREPSVWLLTPGDTLEVRLQGYVEGVGVITLPVMVKATLA